MKKSVLKLGLALAAVAAMSSAANAAVVYTSTAFGGPPAAGQTLVTDFDSPVTVAPGFDFLYAGIDTGLYTGLNGTIAAPPAGDVTQYFAVAPKGIGILESDHSLGSLSILLGSLDTYNTITFNGAGGFTQSFTGAQLHLPADGNQSAGLTNREFYFTFDAADQIDEVVFKSTQYAFEFDNIYAAVVPEPRTWIMLILGFGLTGLMLRRRPAASQLAV